MSDQKLPVFQGCCPKCGRTYSEGLNVILILAYEGEPEELWVRCPCGYDDYMLPLDIGEEPGTV